MILRGRLPASSNLFFLEKWSALNLRGCFVKYSAFSFGTEEKQQKIH